MRAPRGAERLRAWGDRWSWELGAVCGLEVGQAVLRASRGYARPQEGGALLWRAALPTAHAKTLFTAASQGHGRRSALASWARMA